jgi:uncharacterized SAM-binding protein YcdF (DUF218 family)
MIGGDGLATLALSLGVTELTLGASLVPVLVRVLRAARAAPPEEALPSGRGRVLVLGERLPVGGQPGPGYRARLDRALALLAHAPTAEVVILGGRTGRSAPSEAEAGRRYLTERGLAPGRIAVEDASRHTLENLRRYRAAFADVDAGAVALVTSRFHLARASLTATGLGIRHVPCPAEDGWRPGPLEAARLLREAFLVHWYLVGSSYARLTGDRAMLARIA